LLKIEKMPRGTYLTETEEGKIMALHGEGCGLREIAPHIRRQKNENSSQSYNAAQTSAFGICSKKHESQLVPGTYSISFLLDVH
jgi:hypothetical protein